MHQAMPDVLARICHDTLDEVQKRRHALTLDALRRSIEAARDRPRGFCAALRRAVAAGQCGLIAEIKKASPSGGMIRKSFDPAAIAQAYERAGATCLSVLTDTPYFRGEAAHLRAARAATGRPVLRKDFMIDPWQVYESRAMGADCILLIMAALTTEAAQEMEHIARSLDMDVLAEVHDEAELHRALTLQTSLIGINNRNLRTMQTDLQTTIDLAPIVPPDRLMIAESGIRTPDDVVRLAAAGAQCLLVGESLLRQADPAAAVHHLLGTASR